LIQTATVPEHNRSALSNDRTEVRVKGDEWNPARQGEAQPQSVMGSPSPADNGRNFERLKSIAQQTNLTLMTYGPNGAAMNDAAISLLSLSSAKASELSDSISSFLLKLKAAEITHAYVAVGPDGREEVVVPAFDRTQLLDNFQRDVASKLGAEIGDFVRERLSFDSVLAVRNDEMRASRERDQNGREWEIFARTTAGEPVMLNGREVGGTMKVRSRIPVDNKLSSRTGHLFAAYEKLPRRSEDSEPQPSATNAGDPQSRATRGLRNKTNLGDLNGETQRPSR